MSESKLFTLYQDHSETLEQSLAINADRLEGYAKTLAEALASGQKLIIVASGFLAGVAATLNNAFLYRLEVERPSLPVVTLDHNYGLAATMSSDGNYEQFFDCQLAAQASVGDHVLILDSSADAALMAALKSAIQLDCNTAVISYADENSWKKENPDLMFPIVSSAPARGVEAVLFLGLVLCEMVEAELFGF
ncbi:MAG: hypothetical protein B6I36_01115 [Desulfobacteraceae bacterium 4572_35.1]|nr:MAG: hypothetical protein B6I36_01115 [Desulfobacteraceae bacterium 4572_35.1]